MQPRNQPQSEGAEASQVPADFEWMSAEELAAYFVELPSANPANNAHLMAAVNFPGYIDRGLNGPLGGVSSTPSYPFQQGYRQMQHGAPSELGLMTFTIEGKVMDMAQLQAHQADEAEGKEIMARSIAETAAEQRAILAALSAEASAKLSVK